VILGTSFILQTTRSRFCLHSNQGSFTCIHVSSRLSPKRSNANRSVPGKSLQTNFEFPLWEIKLENGKILTEARYRFDVLTEPEVSNDPGNSDSPPTVPKERSLTLCPLSKTSFRDIFYFADDTIANLFTR
jgi:hypothetical protein